MCCSLLFCWAAILPACCYVSTAALKTGQHWHCLAPDTSIAVPGVRFIFIGKLFERRPSYHVLGMLLFAQIAASVSLQGLQQLASQWLPSRGEDSDTADAKKKPLVPAVVLRVSRPPASS